MSILGKIVGQLESVGESSSLGDNFVLSYYSSSMRYCKYILPESSVFTIEKAADFNQRVINYLSVNSTNVSLKIDGVVPTQDGATKDSSTYYMTTDTDEQKTYIFATNSSDSFGSTVSFTEIQIDGVSYTDERIDLTITKVDNSEYCIITAKVLNDILSTKGFESKIEALESRVSALETAGSG